jgi:hypothetical protein
MRPKGVNPDGELAMLALAAISLAAGLANLRSAVR